MEARSLPNFDNELPIIYLGPIRQSHRYLCTSSSNSLVSENSLLCSMHQTLLGRYRLSSTIVEIYLPPVALRQPTKFKRAEYVYCARRENHKHQVLDPVANRLVTRIGVILVYLAGSVATQVNAILFSYLLGLDGSYGQTMRLPDSAQTNAVS